ncbi:MAG TPA: hypothetical protein VMV35_00390 [Halothiobacillus sp.]|nr:hypothetical protein [Halothiobacillus sp.]
MEITCYRDSELLREPRLLAAPTYNLAKTLLSRNRDQCLFLPIRSMQYLAILDPIEIVFIDAARKNLIDIAWQNFHAHDRTALDEPVAYDAVYYFNGSQSQMPRLQVEFFKALQMLAKKQHPSGPGQVIKLAVQHA